MSLSKSVKMLVIVTGGLLLLVCVGSYGLWRTDQAHQEARRTEFENTARQLGIEPTLDGVVDYIYRSIKIGMTRGEVEQVLGSLGLLQVERGELNEDSRAGWGPIACDTIWLELCSAYTCGSIPIYGCYDEMGGLVKMDFAEDDMPLLQIYAPLRE